MSRLITQDGRPLSGLPQGPRYVQIGEVAGKPIFAREQDADFVVATMQRSLAESKEMFRKLHEAAEGRFDNLPKPEIPE